MRKFGFIGLLFVLLSLCAFACAQQIPAALRFTVGEEQITQVDEDRRIISFLPTTARDDVNRELSALSEQMTRDALPVLISLEKTDDDQLFTLKVNTAVSRTGSGWMSFYSTAIIDDAVDQRYNAFDARVYDMETGKRLTPDDVIIADPKARDAVKQALREGIERYFPELVPDEAAIEQALANLNTIPFTLSPGALRFHFRADAFYPGKDTLLHVKLFYPSVKSCLTAEALRQTDNSGYPLIALTFDDGPARTRTTTVVDMLKRYGADGTFFLIGSRIPKNLFAVKYQHDSGFAQESHSFSHKLNYLPHSEIRAEMAAFDEALCAVVGKKASIIRAPGGYEKPYEDAEIALPLIHWTVAAGDGTNTRTYKKRDLQEIYEQVTLNARDGGVVLFHDLRKECTYYLEPILQNLEQNGYLCVSLDELFSLKGIPMEPATTYRGAVLP